MTNRIQIGIALLVLSHGLVGCGDQGSPTAPSAPSPPSVQQPSPQPTGIQPSITAIAPQVGSTRGGAWATITGVDFQPGAKVRLGDTTVSSWTRDSTTISVSGTAAHAAGTIDVIVTNPGGLEARLSGGYTVRAARILRFQRRLGGPCRSRIRDGHAIHHSEQRACQRLMRHVRAFDVRACAIRAEWRVFISRATTASRSPARWYRP